MSILDHQRAAALMTQEDADALLQEGFHPAVVDHLRARGFSPTTLAEDRTGFYFVRLTRTPNILITLETDADIEQLDDAIFDAGGQSRHRLLASYHHQLHDAMGKVWRSTPPHAAHAALEARIAKLEAQTKPQTSN